MINVPLVDDTIEVAGWLRRSRLPYFLYGISGSCKEIPASAFRRCCGTGSRDRDAHECADARSDSAWIYLQRTSRLREDVECTHSCDGAELPQCDWPGGATDGRALRDVRELHGDQGGKCGRCDRDRCGDQPWHRRDS